MHITKETITLIIAVAGFLLSVAQLIYGIYSNRTHFSVEIKNVEKARWNNKNVYIFTFLINNLSSAPLVITQVSTQNVICRLNRKRIGEIYHTKYPETDIPCTERIFSSELPINLTSYASAIHHFIFQKEDGKLNLASPMSVTFQTNKKKKTFNLDCPDPKHLLEL